MSNSTTLDLQVNTSSVATAAQTLDKMVAAGNAAAVSARGVQASTAKASEAIDAQVASLRMQASAYGLSAREAKMMELASNGATTAQLKAADAALKELEARKQGAQVARAAAAESKAASDSAQAAATSSSRAVDAQVASLRQQAAVYGMSTREAKLHELATNGASQAQLKAADAAMRDLEVQKKFADMRRTQRSSLGELDSGYKKVGVSAGQTAAAMRMVPAQMTDIVTQLAGGQNPFLIMIQQGGQMKDSFGGIGSMFSALLGMITPTGIALTAVAAAAGAVGYAFYQSASQTNAFNQALLTTGNSVGKTTAEMTAMAAQIGKTTGSQAGAAEALAMIAGTGKISAESMKGVAEAAVLMERATGKAYKETVAEAVKLGEDPVKASEKLNESMHYLTASQYARIVALKKAGDEDAAAALATSLYAAAATNAANDVISSLGPLESAWLGVKTAASEAWTAMTSAATFGFSTDKIGALTEKVAALKKARQDAGNPTAGPVEMQAVNELGQLTFAAGAEKRIAEKAAAQAEADKKSIEAQKTINALIEGGGSNAVKRARGLEKVAKDFANIKVDPNNPELTSDALSRKRKLAEDAINERYKDPKGAKPREGQSPIERITDQINSDNKNFGQSEVEKKIDAMKRIVDPHSKGANKALSDQLSQTLRDTQGLADAKLRAAAADENQLQELRENQADTTAAYQTNLETQRVYLDAKVITEEQYNERVDSARAGQIASLQATSDAEVAILEAAKGKVKTVAEELAFDKKIESSIKGAAKAIRDLESSAQTDNLKNLAKTLKEINQITDEMATPLDKYNKELEKLNRLKDAGLESGTYERGMKKAWNEYSDAVVKSGKSLSSYEDAARGVGAALHTGMGPFSVALVKGNLNEMEKSFGDMMDNMVAKAIESNLNNAIFGDRPGSTGGGGLLDMATKWATGSSGGSGSGGGAAAAGDSSSGGVWGWIKGLLSSFDGGGSTGDGPRAGGLDGKGGYMAMIHPKEHITDLTKGDMPGSQVSVGVSPMVNMKIEIINNGQASEVESTSQRSDGNGGLIATIVLAAKQEMMKDVASGGEFSQLFSNTMGLNRAAGLRS